MKSIMKTKNALFVMLIAIFTITACSKSDNTLVEEELDLNTVIDQTLAADIFDEISEIGDEAIEHADDILGNFKSADANEGDAENAPGNKWRKGHRHWKGWYYDTINLVGRNMAKLSDCATITREINETRDTMIMIIDWGEENCLGEDGVYRRGKFKMTRIGNFYWDGESNITYTFEDYYVNDHKVEGTKTVRTYMNEEEQRVHEMNDDGTITLAEDAGTVTWEATRTRVVIEGSDTRKKHDDKIEITGSSSGSDADGNTYSSEIITPLLRIIERGCARFPVSGVVEMVKNGETTTIDYGDGTCDNLAEVTKDGETTTIELGKKKREKKTD